MQTCPYPFPLTPSGGSRGPFRGLVGGFITGSRWHTEKFLRHASFVPLVQECSSSWGRETGHTASRLVEILGIRIKGLVDS